MEEPRTSRGVEFLFLFSFVPSPFWTGTPSPRTPAQRRKLSGDESPLIRQSRPALFPVPPGPPSRASIRRTCRYAFSRPSPTRGLRSFLHGATTALWGSAEWMPAS